MIRENISEGKKYTISKKASPQTKEELKIVKENLSKELLEKGLSGIPSQDKAWIKNYTQEQLSLKTPKMSLFEYLYNRNVIGCFAGNILQINSWEKII